MSCKALVHSEPHHGKTCFKIFVVVISKEGLVGWVGCFTRTKFWSTTGCFFVLVKRPKAGVGWVKKILHSVSYSKKDNDKDLKAHFAMTWLIVCVVIDLCVLMIQSIA